MEDVLRHTHVFATLGCDRATPTDYIRTWLRLCHRMIMLT